MEYERMLDRLYMMLPEKTSSMERFELPMLDISVQGKKTLIRNFSQALKAVARGEKQFYKYVTKETATAATIEEGKLVLNGKFFAENINRLWANYLNEYVLCHECKKPDTQIIERNGVKVLKCTACGAMSAIRKL